MLQDGVNMSICGINSCRFYAQKEDFCPALPRSPEGPPGWGSSVLAEEELRSSQVGFVPGGVVHVLENFPHQLLQVFAGSLLLFQRLLHLFVVLS